MFLMTIHRLNIMWYYFVTTYMNRTLYCSQAYMCNTTWHLTPYHACSESFDRFFSLLHRFWLLYFIVHTFFAYF